ncbi:MAG: CBS domain-containing protein [Acetobacteraceae bacterium]|nr:CBS domain-containing protein [Acetobacteraceae bacterium]MBV8525060.1 CBS domain-containing protein [Acetobacteraceae bacterium]
MTRFVEFIDPEATVKEAAELMGELDVGGLPAGTPERIDGIVTDRDLLYRVVARGLDCSQVRVREVLSRPVIACAEDDTLHAAMDMMAANHIRRMPVCNAAGVVTGWITLADFSRRLVVNNPGLQEALRALTEGA